MLALLTVENQYQSRESRLGKDSHCSGLEFGQGLVPAYMASAAQQSFRGQFSDVRMLTFGGGRSG